MWDLILEVYQEAKDWFEILSQVLLVYWLEKGKSDRNHGDRNGPK
ncbi:hypothetical protein [Staphylospora marina]|nr:hypothetical protein [Staphylospora marina]